MSTTETVSDDAPVVTPRIVRTTSVVVDSTGNAKTAIEVTLPNGQGGFRAVAPLTPLDRLMLAQSNVKVGLTEYNLPQLQWDCPDGGFVQCYHYFKKVHDAHRSEAFVWWHWDTDTNRYFMVVPYFYHVTSGSLSYETARSFCRNCRVAMHEVMQHCPNCGPEHTAKCDLRVLGTTHSHGSMAPFHSGTDHANELNTTAFHHTIGHVDRGPLFVTSFVVSDGQQRFTPPVFGAGGMLSMRDEGFLARCDKWLTLVASGSAGAAQQIKHITTKEVLCTAGSSRIAEQIVKGRVEGVTGFIFESGSNVTSSLTVQTDGRSETTAPPYSPFTHGWQARHEKPEVKPGQYFGSGREVPARKNFDLDDDDLPEVYAFRRSTKGQRRREREAAKTAPGREVVTSLIRAVVQRHDDAKYPSVFVGVDQIGSITISTSTDSDMDEVHAGLLAVYATLRQCFSAASLSETVGVTAARGVHAIGEQLMHYVALQTFKVAKVIDSMMTAHIPDAPADHSFEDMAADLLLAYSDDSPPSPSPAQAAFFRELRSFVSDSISSLTIIDGLKALYAVTMLIDRAVGVTGRPSRKINDKELGGWFLAFLNMAESDLAEAEAEADQVPESAGTSDADDTKALTEETPRVSGDDDSGDARFFYTRGYSNF